MSTLVPWSDFSDVGAIESTDNLVGLRSGANVQFDASSLLLVANNLSDVASNTTAFDNVSPLTTTGDLIYFNGTHNVRLAVGSTGYILTVSGGVPDWVVNPGLLAANNLSDVASVPTTLTNLGLASSSTVTFNIFTATTSATSASFISTGLNVLSHANALTAHSGGGQGSALALTKAINRVTTVAAGGDSVVLPASVAGNMVTVINAAASNAMNCFPASGDAINALAVNTALSIVANTSVMFFCAVAGTWNSIVTA